LFHVIHAIPANHVIAVFILPQIVAFFQIPHGEQQMLARQRHHGFEFQPYEDGTLYDLIVKKTDPRYVNFEMDILWAFYPGQDPAALLLKYGSRYKTLHLKDLRKGVQGNMSGGGSPENDVALGTGQIDIPAVLKAASQAGVEHYYIEDESSNSLIQVPQSMAYLKSLRL